MGLFLRRQRLLLLLLLLLRLKMLERCRLAHAAGGGLSTAERQQRLAALPVGSRVVGRRGYRGKRHTQGRHKLHTATLALTMGFPRIRIKASRLVSGPGAASKPSAVS